MVPDGPGDMLARVSSLPLLPPGCPPRSSYVRKPLGAQKARDATEKIKLTWKKHVFPISYKTTHAGTFADLDGHFAITQNSSRSFFLHK